MLVALLLVLLPEPDHLFEDLHVEALALGLGEHVLLVLVQPFDVLLDALDPLDKGTEPIPCDPTRSAHAYLLVNTVARISAMWAHGASRGSPNGEHHVTVIALAAGCRLSRRAPKARGPLNEIERA